MVETYTSELQKWYEKTKDLPLEKIEEQIIVMPGPKSKFGQTIIEEATRAYNQFTNQYPGVKVNFITFWGIILQQPEIEIKYEEYLDYLKRN